jgi:hypothetical protein
MMASDEDDTYKLTPAFGLETVAAAKGFAFCDSQNRIKPPGEKTNC